MEYITRLFVVLCLSLVTVVVLGDNEPEPEATTQPICRTCKAGYFAILECNDNHDTVCAPCTGDSFTPSPNLLNKCTTCSTCGDGYFVMKPCSRHDDTVCESCLSVKDSRLPSYQKRCLDAVVADQTRLLPEPEPKETLVLPEGEGSADGGEEIYLGSEFQAPVLDNTDDIIVNASQIIKFDEDEGSGDEVELNIGAQEEPDTETDLTTSLPPVKDTKSDETEQNITLQSQSTTTQNTELTDGAGSVDFIPMTTTFSTLTAKSTKPSFVRLTAKPEVPTVTPVGSIHIGEGLSVKPEVEFTSKSGVGPSDKNYVLYTASPHNRGKENRVHHHHVENSLDKPVPTAEQKVGAQSSPHEHEEGTSKVTVGVVVAVAVAAAFVFFILGFIVSVRCRRTRESFQVMKKVDKNGSWNSGSPVPINIEYRDEERDGIYDVIDKDTARHPSGKPIKQEHVTPRRVEDLYAVPDRKKKSKDPAPRVDHIDIIKFIDETTDDEFGTKDEELLGLLRKGREGVTHDHNGSIPRLDDSDSGADFGPSDTPPVEVSHQEGETIARDPNVIIEEEENEDESSPMLTNDSQESTLSQDAHDSVED
ncbi:uncharacterized protein LOC110454787 [Mizuhopecten yessoensis]|uniref:uncharacterized protein LOC110454787 n=1 Tax=Mizuhopecten yessoensis TaxID=6573 RepID=UPI000B458E6D|nr:uncharacterized protein LOC110454787 [Mizuhopecten yessoensis]